MYLLFFAYSGDVFMNDYDKIINRLKFENCIYKEYTTNNHKIIYVHINYYVHNYNRMIYYFDKNNDIVYIEKS